ncbi:DNA-binding protein H-NS [Klebsiella pneumoniae]|uniref:DNA-binding protein H-NS n=1 Tax=Klebsiella pneumoniae TaxID=573 RepID=A0A378G044_KLEPN|nr:DNA-binding protein H-NS [Klebsiella pneumoniae]
MHPGNARRNAGKLEVVVNERREEENAAAAEIEERTRKLQQYREMLIADGIDPE